MIDSESVVCCNSFYFYIKPQLLKILEEMDQSCNSFYFYIKPQPSGIFRRKYQVVIHSISTSNHNLSFIII